MRGRHQREAPAGDQVRVVRDCGQAREGQGESAGVPEGEACERDAVRVLRGRVLAHGDADAAVPWGATRAVRSTRSTRSRWRGRVDGVNFYKRYIGDYQRDTGHLSMLEHGAYTLLLDVHYATSSPLPADRLMIYRMARAVTARERKAVDVILEQFWALTKEGWTNARAASEMEKARKQAEVKPEDSHEA